MYKLREFLTGVGGMNLEDVRSDELYCTEMDRTRLMLVNEMREPFFGYAYTFIERGTVTLCYNGHTLTVGAGDLFVYTSGSQNAVVDCSADFGAVSLICDERLVYETPIMRYFVQTSLYANPKLAEPVVRPTAEEHLHFLMLLRGIISYLHSGHRFMERCLRHLFALFVLDMLDMLERNVDRLRGSDHSVELMGRFLKLLPKHFEQHHDLAFYASELCITTTHLSRIVRKATGVTATYFIDRMLFMEASWLLSSTDLTVAAIADRLHFASTASFSRFFSRMKGMSPTAYRER